jgi:hypothetical protein
MSFRPEFTPSRVLKSVKCVQAYLHHSQILQAILYKFLDFALLVLLLVFAESIFRPPQSVLPEVIVGEL